MIPRKTLLLTCCTVFAVVLPLKAFAVCPPNSDTRPQVTVVIGTETRSQPDEVILDDSGNPHTYPNGLTIAPLAGGHAVVRVECDTNGDTLTLKNAKITVTAAPTTQVIQYWATFDKIPRPGGVPASPETGPDVYYKLMGIGSGFIASTNAKPQVYDKITVKGEILNPVPGTAWKTIGTLTKTVSASDPVGPVPVFPNTVSWKWSPRPPELQGERHIRGTVTITLRNPADRVELGGNGIMIINDTSACQDCDPGGENQPNAWCMTTNSTAQALGCPSCLTEDGMVADNQTLHMFAKSNWDNLSQDIARGQGEHLASLAALLRVPAERRPAFFAYAQDQYQQVIRQGKFDPDAMVGALQRSEEVPTLLASRGSGLTSQ